MAVRSFTRGKMDDEKNKPRVRINRDNKKKPATEGSKTQKRKQNKAAHMQTTRQFK